MKTRLERRGAFVASAMLIIAVVAVAITLLRM